MKKSIEKTENPERILIHSNPDVNKDNKELLNEAFRLIKELKGKFTGVGVEFNRNAFLEIFHKGTDWVFEQYFEKVSEMYKSMPPVAQASFLDKERLQKDINPIIELMPKIEAALKKVDLNVSHVPFNDKSDPIVNNDLKEIFEDKSRRYATGPDEIALYGAVKKFIEAVNIFEQFLAKTSYPSMLGIPGPVERIQDFLNRYPFYDSDYFDVDIDSIKDSGCCTLLINPNLFEQLASNIKYFEDFKQHAGLSGAVTGEQELKIPVAPAVRLPRNLGKVIDGTLPPPQTKKGRWSGIGG